MKIEQEQRKIIEQCGVSVDAVVAHTARHSADGDDGGDELGDAQNELMCAQDSDTSDEAKLEHVKNARNALTRHLARCGGLGDDDADGGYVGGGGGDRPVRTQLAAHAVAFPKVR